MSINKIEISNTLEITNSNIEISIKGIFKPIIYILSYLSLINISPIIKVTNNSLIKGKEKL